MKKAGIILLYLLFTWGIKATSAEENLISQYNSCQASATELLPNSPGEALKYVRREIKRGEKSTDNNQILAEYLHTSRTFYLLHQYETALQYAHKAIELSKKMHDLDSNAEAKRLCGAIYTDLNNKENAWKYLDEALAYYASQKDTACYVRALGTKAISLGKNRQYDECIKTFWTIYRLNEQRKEYKMMLITLLNLANAYILTDHTDESLQMLDSIKSRIPPQFISLKDSITINSYLGELLFRQKSYREAKAILNKTAEQARTHKSYEVLQSALKSLIKIAKEENDLAGSFRYFEEAFDIQDSIASIETKNKVSEMEVIFEVTQKNAEIDRLIMQNKWNRQKLLFIFIIFAAVCAFIIIRMKSHTRVMAYKTQLLDNELKNKRGELTNLAIYHYEQKRMIDNLYKNLKQTANSCTDTDTRKTLSNLCTQMLKTSTYDTKAKINSYIDTNYSDFITKINARFPDLSDSEKRICAMLLVDFSTKEISEVLNISDKSINNIRSKIRKKMGIPEDKSISKFLQSL